MKRTIFQLELQHCNQGPINHRLSRFSHRYEDDVLEIGYTWYAQTIGSRGYVPEAARVL